MWYKRCYRYSVLVFVLFRVSKWSSMATNLTDNLQLTTTCQINADHESLNDIVSKVLLSFPRGNKTPFNFEIRFTQSRSPVNVR